MQAAGLQAMAMAKLGRMECMGWRRLQIRNQQSVKSGGLGATCHGEDFEKNKKNVFFETFDHLLDEYLSEDVA
jgi:hypothetical protein